MSMQLRINGEKIIYNQGAVIDDRVDYGLDSAYVEYIDDPSIMDGKPFEQFSVAEFGFGADVFKMFVAEDEVKMIIRSPEVYQHNITFVELTKILEKFLIGNITLTNTTLTLYEQVENACFNAVPHIVIPQPPPAVPEAYAPYEFILDASLEGLLSVPAEEFMRQNVTLRELLDDIFGAVKCRVEVIDYAFNDARGCYEITLGAVNFNRTQAAEPQGEIMYKAAKNNVEDYCGAVVSAVSNGLSNNLIIHEDTVKSRNYTVDSENKILMFPFAIYARQKFEFSTQFITIDGDPNNSINITYRKESTGNQAVSSVDFFKYDRWIDATDFFVDKEYYDTLNKISEGNTPNYPVQNNTIYFVRGNDSVDVSRTYRDVFFTQSVIENLMANAAYSYVQKNYKELLAEAGVVDVGEFVATSAGHSMPHRVDNAIFRTQYYPTVDTIVSVPKPRSNKFERCLGVFQNQEANMPDLNRLGDSLFFEGLRKGNNEEHLDEVLDGAAESVYGNMLPLFGNVNGSIVYKRSYAIYDNAIEVRYYLAKDYGTIFKRNEIARAKRIYAIPLTGTRTIVDLPVSIVATEEAPPTGAVNFLTYVTLTSFLKTLRSETDDIKARWLTVDGPNAKFALPTSNYAVGNTMNFEAKFYDNFGAGMSLTPKTSIFDWLGGRRVAFNSYVDQSGERISFICQLVKSIDFGSGTDYLDRIQKLPELDIGGTISPLSNVIERQYIKDRAEAISIKVTAAVLSGSKNVFIGTELCKNNNLIGGAKPLYFWYSLSETYTGTESFCKGTQIEGYDTSIYVDITQKSGYTELKLSPAAQLIGLSWKSWAIGDEHGRLYFAVNGNSLKTINFYDKISNKTV